MEADGHSHFGQKNLGGLGIAMPVVVSIPDNWFGSDEGAINCPKCGELQTTWSEVFGSQHMEDGQRVLLFKCAKCHNITRELLVQKNKDR